MGDYSFAVGLDNSSSGTGAVGLGYKNTALANYTFVAGNSNMAQSESEAVLGMYSKSHTIANNNTDPIFAIGNGTSSINRSDAVLVLKNANTTIGGSLTLNGNGTNSSITFPTGRGTSGQVLTSDGSGGIEWTLPSGGTVTGVSGTAPIVSSGGAAPVISISAATTSAAGSMSAADKAKLNAATNANTASTLVIRDASGNFSAGTVTASLTGNATTSTHIAGGLAGSVPYQTAANNTTFLAKGTAGQVLTMNSGATAPEWKLLSKADIGLGSVENTALTTWTGSTNLITVGTISSGTWHGTAVAESYVGNLSASKITSGTFDNSRINWAAPGTIGSTTASTGAFTTLSANNGLSVTNGTVTIKPAGSGGTSGQVLTSDGAGNATWQAATGGVTTLSMRYIICAAGYFPSGDMDNHFIGEVILFAGSANRIPDNFLECNGQSIPVASYMTLYSIIGNLYGGNTTNFNVPNLSGKVPKGL
jgi:microcystin-dependent protein